MSFVTFFYPILFFITLSLLGIYGIRQNLNRNLSFCVKETNTLQSKHKKITLRLLKLNKVAKQLRIQRKLAQAAFIAAPPLAKAQAKAYLEFVKVSQRVFRAGQQALFLRALVASTTHSSQLVSKGFLSKNINFDLQLEAYPKKSDSPSYRLKSNYIENKKIYFFKYINFFKNFPPLLLKIFKQKPRIYQVQCGSVILKKGGKPSEIKIIQGRY